MSGMKNLANAIENDHRFLKEVRGLMDEKLADQLVCDPKDSDYAAPKRRPGAPIKGKSGY